MIRGQDNVFKWMELNNAPYWMLYRSGNVTHKVAEVDHGRANLSLKESQDMLAQYIEAFGNSGRYEIVSKTKADDKRGGVYREQIELIGHNIPGQAQGAAIGAINMTDVEKRIADAKREWDKDHEIKELKRRIDESEKKQSSFIGQIQPILTPILQPIIEGLAGKYLGQPQVAVSGFEKTDMNGESETVEKASPEELKRVQDAIERLNDVLTTRGENVVDLLEKLADTAEQNPEKIFMAIKML